jgi:hypothetical protein
MHICACVGITHSHQASSPAISAVVANTQEPSAPRSQEGGIGWPHGQLPQSSQCHWKNFHSLWGRFLSALLFTTKCEKILRSLTVTDNFQITHTCYGFLLLEASLSKFPGQKLHTYCFSFSLHVTSVPRGVPLQAIVLCCSLQTNSQDFPSVHRPLHLTSESYKSRFQRSDTQTHTPPQRPLCIGSREFAARVRLDL